MSAEQALKQASLEIKAMIKKELAARNIKQQDLVEMTGLSKAQISKAVNGNTGKRNEEIRDLINKKLGISPKRED